jgi:hypothetical protein
VLPAFCDEHVRHAPRPTLGFHQVRGVGGRRTRAYGEHSPCLECFGRITRPPARAPARSPFPPSHTHTSSTYKHTQKHTTQHTRTRSLPLTHALTHSLTNGYRGRPCPCPCARRECSCGARHLSFGGLSGSTALPAGPTRSVHALTSQRSCLTHDASSAMPPRASRRGSSPGSGPRARARARLTRLPRWRARASGGCGGGGEHR